MKCWILAAVVACAIGCASTSTEGTPTADAPKPAGPRFINISLSDRETDPVPMKTFNTETAKIWVFFGLENVKKGSKVRGVWICEKAPNIPANFEIADTTLEVGLIDNVANFSLSKPNQGWPPGEYRVELHLDGQLLEKVPFTIQIASQGTP